MSIVKLSGWNLLSCFAAVVSWAVFVLAALLLTIKPSWCLAANLFLGKSRHCWGQRVQIVERSFIDSQGSSSAAIQKQSVTKKWPLISLVLLTGSYGHCHSCSNVYKWVNSELWVNAKLLKSLTEAKSACSKWIWLIFVLLLLFLKYLAVVSFHAVHFAWKHQPSLSDYDSLIKV